MSGNSKSSWWDRIGPLAAVVSAVVALALLVFGAGFVYQRFIDVPRLRYTVLPSYQLPESALAAIVVENRGQATAHDVLIRASFSGANIEQYTVNSSEIFTLAEGGEGAPFVALSLKRMVSGSSVTLYILTSKQGDLESVTVTADEGPGLKGTVGRDFMEPRSSGELFSVIVILAVGMYAIYELLKGLMQSIKRLLLPRRDGDSEMSQERPD